MIKLADLGSCRGIYSRQPFTEYISTRWYRAPECLLTDRNGSSQLAPACQPAKRSFVGCLQRVSRQAGPREVSDAPPPEATLPPPRGSCHLTHSAAPPGSTRLHPAPPGSTPPCAALPQSLPAHRSAAESGTRMATTTSRWTFSRPGRCVSRSWRSSRCSLVRAATSCRLLSGGLGREKRRRERRDKHMSGARRYGRGGERAHGFSDVCACEDCGKTSPTRIGADRLGSSCHVARKPARPFRSIRVLSSLSVGPLRRGAHVRGSAKRGGRNEMDQIQKIHNILGTPSPETRRALLDPEREREREREPSPPPPRPKNLLQGRHGCPASGAGRVCTSRSARAQCASRGVAVSSTSVADSRHARCGRRPSSAMSRGARSPRSASMDYTSRRVRARSLS